MEQVEDRQMKTNYIEIFGVGEAGIPDAAKRRMTVAIAK